MGGGTTDLAPRASPSGWWLMQVAMGLSCSLSRTVAAHPHLHANLSPVERFNLVSDTWSGPSPGRGRAANYLDLVELFRDETDLNVWRAIIGSFSNYLAFWRSRSEALEACGATCAGFPPPGGWVAAGGGRERELVSQLRGDLLNALGTRGVRISREPGRGLRAFRSRRESVDRNVVPALVSILAHSGEAAGYEEFKQH